MRRAVSRHILLERQARHLLHVALSVAGGIGGLHALGVNRYGKPNYPYDNIVASDAYRSGAIGTFYFNSSSPLLKPCERLEVTSRSSSSRSRRASGTCRPSRRATRRW